MKRNSLLDRFESVARLTEIMPIESEKDDLDLTSSQLKGLQTTLERIRAIADFEVQKSHGSTQELMSGEASYPIGYCNHITEKVRNILRKQAWFNSFVGTAINKDVYGVWNEDGMQNAIQVGGGGC